MSDKAKAQTMRNAIDGIENALMGCGDFVELQRIFDGSPDSLQIAPKMTVGQMRRVCKALAECTRIINSDDYVIERPSPRHLSDKPEVIDGCECAICKLHRKSFHAPQ